MRRGVIVIGLSAVVFGSNDARAEPVLRPSAHGAFHAYEGSYAGGGNALLAAGYNVELEPILIVPEIAASMGGFDGGFRGFTARALGGMRLGVAYLGSFEPSLLVRGGYGHMRIERQEPVATTLSPSPLTGTEVLHSGALQAGVSLEHRVSRDITLGGELLYDAFFYRRPGVTLTADETAVVHSVAGGFTVGFWL